MLPNQWALDVFWGLNYPKYAYFSVECSTLTSGGNYNHDIIMHLTIPCLSIANRGAIFPYFFHWESSSGAALSPERGSGEGVTRGECLLRSAG